MAAYRRVYDSHHLHAVKNRDLLRNPTLGNRVGATFTFFCYRKLPTPKALIGDLAWCKTVARWASNRRLTGSPDINR